MGFLFMKNVFKLIFVIIGTMIGAGFASGQEMYLFFFSHGIEGIIGIIISSSIIGIVTYKTFQVINKYKINNYKDFLKILFKKENKLISILNIIINVFILITFFIMIAGFGAYFEQEMQINSSIASSILAIISFGIFLTSVKGFVKVNEMLIPILLIFLVIIGVVNLKGFPLTNLQNYVIKTNQSNFVISAILYSSYNSILLIPVLLTLKDYIQSKKQILKVAIISTIIIILLSLIIFSLLIKVDVDITKLEMPAVYVISKISRILKYIYGFIILGSIFTTAISLGTSFLQNVAKNKKSYTQIALIMCITSVLVSKIGFSNLVEWLYPIFGYLGIFQILRLMII